MQLSVGPTWSPVCAHLPRFCQVDPRLYGTAERLPGYLVQSEATPHLTHISTCSLPLQNCRHHCSSGSPAELCLGVWQKPPGLGLKGTVKSPVRIPSHSVAGILSTAKHHGNLWCLGAFWILKRVREKNESQRRKRSRSEVFLIAMDFPPF